MKRYIIRSVIIFLATSFAFAGEPYTILISFDGFRWDYANRGITPTLEYMKQNGVAAMSLKPAFPSITFPNHLTIITGKHPSEHGVILNYFKNQKGDIFQLSDSNQVRNPQWYKGEAFWETARKHGIITASYYWPGSELTDSSRRPNYNKKYNHTETAKNKIRGIINWLSLPYSERPKFVTLYFHDSDSDGHKYGTSSKEIDSTISHLDEILGELINETAKIGMKDSVNFIVLSDHGMTDISEERIIDLKALLSGFEVEVNDVSAIAMIRPEKESDLNRIYTHLKKHEKFFKVYKKDEVPDYFHFSNNENIYPIVLIPETAWAIRYKEKKHGYAKAEHGYDNNHTDMHGFFFAMGPSFRKGYKIGTINNTSIYPLLCLIYNLPQTKEKEKSAENLRYILSNE